MSNRVFGITLFILLVVSAIVAVGSKRLADHDAYVRLENPATYHG